MRIHETTIHLLQRQMIKRGFSFEANDSGVWIIRTVFGVPQGDL